MSDVRRFLATGPEGNLYSFHYRVCHALNYIRRRRQTAIYTCMAEDAGMALDAAREAEVTLQEIIITGKQNPSTHDLGGGASVTVSDNIEEYQLLHEAGHKMAWKAKSSN